MCANRSLVTTMLGVVAACTLLGAAAPARAIPQAEKRAAPMEPAVEVTAVPVVRRALLVGVTTYRHSGWGNLRYPAKDAADLATVLRDPEQGDWTSANVTVLTDAAATRAALQERLLALLGQSRPGDFLLVYFSGHGFKSGSNTYLALHDTDPERPETGLELGDVRHWLATRADGAAKLLVLDACHSGAAVGPVKGSLRYEDLARSLVALGGGVGFITSSGAGESSMEDPEAGNGAMTVRVLEALRGEASGTGMFVTLADTWNHVRRKVVGQTPQQGGDLVLDIPLARRRGSGGRVLPSAVEELVPVTLVGRLQVNASVGGADVSVDGRVLTTTHAGQGVVIANVKAGPRRVSVAKPGWEPWEASVEVVPGETVEVTAALRPQAGVAPSVAPAPALALPLAGHRALGRNGSGYEVFERGKDGARVVLVPGGVFRMGSETGDTDEKPVHEVELARYLLDEREVTWAQYRRVRGTTPTKPRWNPADDHPVVNVTWDEAGAYCEAVGGRLPTEAEWELAARGKEGREYPWGSEFDCRKGNFDDEDSHDARVVPGGKGCDGHERTARVGSIPAGAGPYGHVDLAGNVWEWVWDWAGTFPSGREKDPKGPGTGQWRVLRGGSFFDTPRGLRGAFRGDEDPSARGNGLGFRCAQDVP